MKSYISQVIDQAQVIEDVLTDGSKAYNVEYRDKDGYPILTVGCLTQQDAELLSDSLNNAAWVQVDFGETIGKTA